MALCNQSLPQADSLFKAAITLIQEVPPYTGNLSSVSTSSFVPCFFTSSSCSETIEVGGSRSNEEWLLNFLNYFASVLVTLPGHPEQGPFYLVKGLIKVVQDYPWDTGSTAKSQAFLTLLSYFSTQAQTSLPYHIPKGWLMPTCSFTNNNLLIIFCPHARHSGFKRRFIWRWWRIQRRIANNSQ